MQIDLLVSVVVSVSVCVCYACKCFVFLFVVLTNEKCLSKRKAHKLSLTVRSAERFLPQMNAGKITFCTHSKNTKAFINRMF